MLDENGKAKYADFGASLLFENDDDMVGGTAGTITFLAPECVNPSVKQYSGRAADIWALGITLFAFTFNQIPFFDDNEMEIFNLI